MRVRPQRSDLALSLGVLALGLAEVVMVPLAGLSKVERSGEAMALVVVTGCVAFRRSLPVWSAVLALLGLMVVSLAWTDSRTWEIAVVIIAMYSCARYSSWHGAWTALALGVVYGLLTSLLEQSDSFWMYVGNFLFYLALMVLIPWSAGVALRRRERVSRHDAERAVEEERVRIARELHDVVGHALGVVVVQAEGERALLPSDAPDSTRETLATIAQTAREALDDVRRLLLIMRTTDELGPQPGLADLPRLLDGMAAAGLPAELVVEGEPRPAPAAVDLTAYRVVQEALTNSLRHSRDARARVVIRYATDAIDIEVTDDGQTISEGGPRGFGLLGMRERVALFGGSLAAGPRPGGGFGVQVHLPSGTRLSDDPSRSRV
jgi:signal transduction histidine kinase